MPRLLKNTTIEPRRVGIDELVADIAALFGRDITQPTVKRILQAYHGRIYHHLSNGHSINLPRVGVMEPRLRRAARIWSPDRGEYIDCPERLQPHIRWSRSLRAELAEHTEVFSDED